jgi:hypothetical protein
MIMQTKYRELMRGIEGVLIGYLRLAVGPAPGQAPVQVLAGTLPQCGCLLVSLVWLSHVA